MNLPSFCKSAVSS